MAVLVSTSDVQDVFDLFDFWDGRDGFIDAVKVGDLLRCVDLNPTLANIRSWGGEDKPGTYVITCFYFPTIQTYVQGVCGV